MTWFIDQAVQIFTWFFGILANIKFMGTNLLAVITTVLILSALLPVILTIASNVNAVGTRSERIKERIDKNDKK